MSTPLEQLYPHSDLYTNAWARLLGRLVAHTGRIDLAEDALADAFAAAARQWADDTPTNPEGWLFLAAKRRVIDGLRHEIVEENHRRRTAESDLRLTTATTTTYCASDGVDDRLQLLWLATHPALAAEVRPALALRFVLGVSTTRIAELFLVPESTMAARLTRAKKRIVATGIRFTLDESGRWLDRADDIARTLLLAYTAGYYGNDEGRAGPGTSEAVELARLAADLVPDSASLSALAALVTLQHARRDARSRPDGTLVTLVDQNRSQWSRTEITDGLRRFSRLEPTTGLAEQLRLMAAVAALHSVAPTLADTNWRRIDGAYAQLEALTNSPVVRLNRAAGQYLSGQFVDPQTLELLPAHHRVSLLRAEILGSVGDTAGECEALRAAYEQCREGPERRHIARRLADSRE